MRQDIVHLAGDPLAFRASGSRGTFGGGLLGFRSRRRMESSSCRRARTNIPQPVTAKVARAPTKKPRVRMGHRIQRQRRQDAEGGEHAHRDGGPPGAVLGDGESTDQAHSAGQGGDDADRDGRQGKRTGWLRRQIQIPARHAVPRTRSATRSATGRSRRRRARSAHWSGRPPGRQAPSPCSRPGRVAEAVHRTNLRGRPNVSTTLKRDHRPKSIPWPATARTDGPPERAGWPQRATRPSRHDRSMTTTWLLLHRRGPQAQRHLRSPRRRAFTGDGAALLRLLRASAGEQRAHSRPASRS